MAGDAAPIIAMVNQPMGQMAQQAGIITDHMPKFNLQMLKNAIVAAMPVQDAMKAKDLREL